MRLGLGELEIGQNDRVFRHTRSPIVDRVAGRVLWGRSNVA